MTDEDEDQLIPDEFDEDELEPPSGPSEEDAAVASRVFDRLMDSDWTPDKPDDPDSTPSASCTASVTSSGEPTLDVSLSNYTWSGTVRSWQGRTVTITDGKGHTITGKIDSLYEY